MIKKDYKEIKNEIIEQKFVLKVMKSRINIIEFLIMSLNFRIYRRNVE